MGPIMLVWPGMAIRLGVEVTEEGVAPRGNCSVLGVCLLSLWQSSVCMSVNFPGVARGGFLSWVVGRNTGACCFLDMSVLQSSAC